ncbi:MAG TPA: ubiquinol-cytochrome c reductase iron-sulfur subunit [Anaerolineales bacterium]|nr:ubiquinol-cytochrome c reductase iron-sulfur subunit [Anaerolineales bacterium]
MKESGKKVSRRDFMKATIATLGGIIGAAIGIPAVSYLIGPAQKSGDTDWIRLGSVNKVEMNIPTLFKTTIETQTGWVKEEEEFSVYVLTENGRDFTIMSNVCTHLGCRVRWIDDQDLFFCPCHNAAFARDGSVLDGPPPRPLDRFESMVEDGILFVKRGA